MTAPTSAPMFATIKGHGAPDRALWYGAEPTPETVGRPCSIRQTAGGWRVQCDDQRPWHIGTRTQVWLGPLVGLGNAPMQVLNPAPIGIKLRTATSGAYRHLHTALTAAARAASDAADVAEAAGMTAEATDMRTVRDALRKAAVDALAPVFRGKGNGQCRRCGTECTACNPDQQ